MISSGLIPHFSMSTENSTFQYLLCLENQTKYLKYYFCALKEKIQITIEGQKEIFRIYYGIIDDKATIMNQK